MRNKEYYSAFDLVDMYIDLLGMTRGLDEWGESRFSNNEPRFVRYKRISALCQFYLNDGSHKTIVSIERGNMLHYESIVDVKAVLGVLSKYCKGNPKNSLGLSEGTEDGWEEFKIFFIYQKLFAFKKKLHDFRSYGSGVYSASFPYSVPLKLGRGVVNSIDQEQVDKIDEVLEILISPRLIKVSYETLVNGYQFPDVDIDKLDIQWF